MDGWTDEAAMVDGLRRFLPRPESGLFLLETVTASSSRPSISGSSMFQGYFWRFNPARRRRVEGISIKLQEGHIPETAGCGIQPSHLNRSQGGRWPARLAGHLVRARDGMTGQERGCGTDPGRWYPS